MVPVLSLGLALIFWPSSAISEPAHTDRVAIQKGSFQGCIEKMPPEVIARLGRLATERFLLLLCVEDRRHDHSNTD
jgi:hypothetical protein